MGTPIMMSDEKIETVKYNPEYKRVWDDFVESSKNGTFLFKRDYMEYHSDRFHDFSLLFYRKNKLYCLLPACIKDEMLSSHAGLTYGGLVMSNECTVTGILDIFESIKNLSIKNKIKGLIYKPVPFIYSSLPSQEDLYALFRNNATLTVRNVSSVISVSNPLKMRRIRIAGINKAINHRVSVKLSDDLPQFWEILNENLRSKYNSSPVHSIYEISTLAEKFPDNIKLWGAFIDERMVGGILCYYTATTVHTQYISANETGKKVGAIDLIIDHLLEYRIPEYHSEKKWLDMGTSNEDGGKFLNESLIYQKEGFGGRAVCYDTYEIKW